MSSFLFKWLSSESRSCTGIPSWWQLNNMKNSAAREMWEHNFPAYLLWQARRRLKQVLSQQTHHLSLEEGYKEWLMHLFLSVLPSIKSDVERITCSQENTWHLIANALFFSYQLGPEQRAISSNIYSSRFQFRWYWYGIFCSPWIIARDVWDHYC